MKFPWQNISAKLLRPDQYAGVEVVLGKSETIYRLVVLRQQQGRVELVQGVVECGSMADMQDILPADCPVELVLRGKGILQKNLKTSGAKSDHQLLQQMLPNAPVHQFYLQKTEKDEETLVAIVRKSLLESCCQAFADQSILVTGVSLGSFDEQILQAVVQDPNQLEALRKGETADLLLQDQSSLPALLAGSYTAALKGLLQIASPLLPESIQANKEEFFHQKIFQKASMALLIFFFGLLLINTAFYYYYKDKSEQLATAMIHSRGKLSELDQIKNQVDQQQALLQQTSINQRTRTSFFADQIGASLPNGLQLKELDIFPRIGKERDYEKGSLIRYDRQTIRIKGWCKNSLTYNRWIKTLEEKDWVQKARHLNYQDLNKDLGEFELQLLVKADAL